MKQHLDMGSLIVIIVTFILFLVAPFAKGFTHDLLLEAGVFLVSVKLIMMAHKNNSYARWLEKEMKELKALVEEK